MQKPLIGFIGQGFIGKNYSDDFEARGFKVIRYAKEKQYLENKDLIKTCDIVFIAVPTPTTPKGYDDSIIRSVLPLVGAGKIAVLKSTILPGLTRKIQKDFKNITVVHSPEFLSETTAAYDASHPHANIIGIPQRTPKYLKAAKLAHSVLPKASFQTTVLSEEAELIKYAHNCAGYTQVIFFNMVYDLAQKMGASWKSVQTALSYDPYIAKRYINPVHKTGRGAGGHCFIKDFSAFSSVYSKVVKDPVGSAVLKAMEKKNIDLLRKSKKDLDLLKGVYGKLK